MCYKYYVNFILLIYKYRKSLKKKYENNNNIKLIYETSQCSIMKACIKKKCIK